MSRVCPLADVDDRAPDVRSWVQSGRSEFGGGVVAVPTSNSSLAVNTYAAFGMRGPALVDVNQCQPCQPNFQTIGYRLGTVRITRDRSEGRKDPCPQARATSDGYTKPSAFRCADLKAQAVL